MFDLFHTLVSVPPPAAAGEPSVAELLGVPTEEWQRRYYEEDILGRCVGVVVDPIEAMRLVTHSIDPTVPEERIHAAVRVAPEPCAGGSTSRLLNRCSHSGPQRPVRRL